MDAVVQFVRNLLSCCKDLSVFEGTILHDAAVTRQHIGDFLPAPLDKTTPLEVIISVTQLYAFFSGTRSGWTLLTTSLGKFRRILRLIESRLSTTHHEWTHADRIVNESLFKEAKFALRSAFVGLLVFPLGIAFFWLFANSWHVTETDWIGGVRALIHALIVMEIALFPLLYFMIVDGFEMLAKSKRCKAFVEKIGAKKLKVEEIGVQKYQTMTGWVPFWDTGVPIGAKPAKDEEEQVRAEVKKVQATLDSWFPSNKKKNGEKESKTGDHAFEDAKEKLESAVYQFRLEGYREFLYFVFNFVAFYGYLMAPLAFYYHDEEKQPLHVQSLKLFYDNEYADWAGNFAGDVMWTIEPLVILGSPFLIQLAKPKSVGKVKSD